MNNRINSIIDSSDKIIKTLISEHSNEDNTIKIENEYIFLFNSLNRFNQLTATYKNTPIDKDISRFILLRPLILDTMLFFLLLKLGENEQWNRFHNILNDCISEGLDKYFNTLKKSIEIDKLNNEDKNEKLKLFHFDYRYFFEDNSTYKNPKLKKFNFNITPYNILKELENEAGYEKLEKLNICYQILSKYEHSTIISLKLSKENKIDYNLIPILEIEIYIGYLNLLRIISKCFFKKNNTVFNIVINEINHLKIKNPPQYAL